MEESTVLGHIEVLLLHQTDIGDIRNQIQVLIITFSSITCNRRQLYHHWVRRGGRNAGAYQNEDNGRSNQFREEAWSWREFRHFLKLSCTVHISGRIYRSEIKYCVSIRVWSKVRTEVREPVLSELTWHYKEWSQICQSSSSFKLSWISPYHKSIKMSSLGQVYLFSFSAEI